MLRLSRSNFSRRIQINIDKPNKTVTIKGIKNQPSKVQALPFINPQTDFDTCPLRSRGIEPTKNDVLLLKQFMRSDGTILNLEDTHLAESTYNKVVSCIRMAQREGLLPSDEPEYDHFGAPLPNLKYKEARYHMGSRQNKYLLTNRSTREDFWWLREGHDVGCPEVERDAPRVNYEWPKRTHKLVKYSHDDPRVKKD